MNLFRFGSDIAGMRAANREIEAEKLQYNASVLRVEQVSVDSLTQLDPNPATSRHYSPALST